MTTTTAKSPEMYVGALQTIDRSVQWTYQRDGVYLHCELRSRYGASELRAWGDDGASRLHRRYASAIEGVRDQLAFEHFWISDGWRLHDFKRRD